MKKFVILFILFFSFMVNGNASVCNKNINVYIFHGSTCPHCKAAIEYFDELSNEIEGCFSLKMYEVFDSADNSLLMSSVASYFKDEGKYVPYIVIGDKTFVGYASSDNETLKETIISYANSDNYEDIVSGIESGKIVAEDKKEDEMEELDKQEEKISIDNSSINNYSFKDYISDNIVLVIVGLISILALIISIVNMICIMKMNVSKKK